MDKASCVHALVGLLAASMLSLGMHFMSQNECSFWGVKMARGIYNSMLILGIKLVLRFVGQKEKANASQSLNMVVTFWVAFILSLSYMSLSHSHKQGNS